MIKKFSYSLLLLFSIISYAQQGTSSPYSFYGIGDVRFKGTNENRAMGGLSFVPDSIHINIQNPTIAFTMIAPNCENDKFKPTAGHENTYYFSPARIVLDCISRVGGQSVPKRAKTV